MAMIINGREYDQPTDPVQEQLDRLFIKTVLELDQKTQELVLDQILEKYEESSDETEQAMWRGAYNMTSG